MMKDFKFKIGDLLYHILTKEKFIVIGRREADMYNHYKCRTKIYRIEEFYEFELRKAK